MSEPREPCPLCGRKDTGPGIVKAADELTRLRAENGRMREALEPFATFIDQFERKPMKLADEFYAIHVGTEFEAKLSFAHLRTARQALGTP